MTRTNQSQPRRRSMTAARKQAQTTAMMDIQRQGNCTKRNLGRKPHMAALRRNIISVAAEPSKIRAPQSDLWELELPAFLANRPEKRAVNAPNKISARAQNEEIQLNQVCSTSAICVNRKFWSGSSPLARA